MTPLEQLADLGKRGLGVRLDYVQDYGADKRKGWSLSIDGSFYSTFRSTPEKAIEDGVRRYQALKTDKEEEC